MLSIDALRPDRLAGDNPVCPFLARLQAQSLRAETSYATAPSTVGSLPELMTSTPPLAFGGFDWGIHGRPRALGPHLAMNGYDAHHVVTLPWGSMVFGHGQQQVTNHHLVAAEYITSSINLVTRPYFERGTGDAASLTILRRQLPDFLRGYFATMDQCSKQLPQMENRQANDDMLGYRRQWGQILANCSAAQAHFLLDESRYIEKILATHGLTAPWSLGEVLCLSSRFEVAPRRLSNRILGKDHWLTTKLSSRKKNFVDASTIVDKISEIFSRPAKAKPIFVWAHFFDCHLPYAGGEGRNWKAQTRDWLSQNRPDFNSDLSLAWLSRPRNEREWRDWEHLYDAAAAEIDRQIERLIGMLDGMGHRDTIVAVVSDHGEELGEHGDRSHTFRLYEHNAKVVCFFHSGTGRRVIPGFASLRDVAPTICGLAGISTPDGWQGRNLVTHDSLPESMHFRTFYGSPSVTAWRKPYVAYRRGQWKLMHTPELARSDRFSKLGTQLFNLSDDPDEQHDLIERYPEVAAQLLALAIGEKDNT